MVCRLPCTSPSSSLFLLFATACHEKHYGSLSEKMGMASALETLCGQSYGANQFHMLGIHMQRAMFDGIQSVLSGTVRGCGWQKIGAFVNLGAYYLVRIPSAILLAFELHVGGKVRKARPMIQGFSIGCAESCYKLP